MSVFKQEIQSQFDSALEQSELPHRLNETIVANATGCWVGGCIVIAVLVKFCILIFCTVGRMNLLIFIYFNDGEDTCDRLIPVITNFVHLEIRKQRMNGQSFKLKKKK